MTQRHTHTLVRIYTTHICVIYIYIYIYKDNESSVGDDVGVVGRNDHDTEKSEDNDSSDDDNADNSEAKGM